MMVMFKTLCPKCSRRKRERERERERERAVIPPCLEHGVYSHTHTPLEPLQRGRGREERREKRGVT